MIYLFECKQCQYSFPYVDSTKTKFRYRINDYKPSYRKFRKKYVEKDLAIVTKNSELKQKLFHEYYCFVFTYPREYFLNQILQL